MTTPSNDLKLVVGTSQLSGWTRVRVSRGVERCPSDFEIEMTEKYPGQPFDITVQPGDACQVMIGADLVITGYVDRVSPSLDPRTHSITVSGRGKCQDLVDCAAEWPGGQILGSSVLDIATKLASYYGITVSCTGEAGSGIPQFNLMLGETAYDVIERICRYRALLPYEGVDGNLILGAIGTMQAANGFTEGINVEKAKAIFSIDQRYSEYLAFLQSVDVFTDTGDGGNLFATVNDPTVLRHRRRVIIAEAGGGGRDVAIQRANWECARRYGRSFVVALTTDSWRDSAGALYTPNTLVPLALPTLKVTGKTWVVSDVTYMRDENGTRASLMIMPQTAFYPEPILLQPFPADVLPGIVQ
jgi:prophage tail gpP-like protein